MQRAGKGLADGLLQAVGVAQRKYLAGPRPEKIQSVTKRLRDSISSEVEVTADKVIGKIGSNLPYAAFQEFGFHGTEQVRAHTRVIKQVNHIGNAIDLRRMIRVIRDGVPTDVGYDRNRKQAAKGQPRGLVFVQFVKAHSRNVDYAGKPYVQPALSESMPFILKRVARRIMDASASQDSI